MNKRIISVVTLLCLLVSCLPMSAFAKTSIHLAKSSGYIYVDDSYHLKLKNSSDKTIPDSKIKWTTSNKSVATVTKSGYVKGKKSGEAVINAKYNGKTYSFIAKIRKPWTEEEIKSLFDVDDEELKAIMEDILKEKGYVSKSEVEKIVKENQSTNTVIINNDNEPKTKDDVKIVPNKPVVYKNFKYYITDPESMDQTYEKVSEITISSISIENIEENSYDNFLNYNDGDRDDENGGYKCWPHTYYNYNIMIKVEGYVDPEYKGSYVRIEFNGDKDQRDNWQQIFATVNEDGSFSDIGILKSNYIPNKLTMVYVDMWNIIV